MNNSTANILRVRVAAVGRQAIECRGADGTALRVGYCTDGHDSSYLRALLRLGMPLNLVDACEAPGGMWHARFIVAEPDYLVNATAVAGCMAEYGDSPLVGLMRKLGPAPNSQALQMGNFAGRLLDEALHGDSRTKPYALSATDFFRTSAIGIMALGAEFDSSGFHRDAQMQLANIREAVERGLAEAAGGFDPSEAIVEPSFFCEALGLQGRMDCLALDGSLVVEQKSGKGGFGSRGDMPVLRREHYVQLLLYRAALRYGHPGTDAKALLLYSKYARGIVVAGESGPLLQQAMELRNRIALAETAFAREGFGVLVGLTPEALNTNSASGTLWTRYQRKQLAEALAPIAAADELELAYFLRMMRFVAMEHMLGKLGNSDGTGFAAAWLCTPAEKRAAGNMLDGMRLLPESVPAAGKVETLRLACPDDGSGDAANFRVADIVLLYAYDEGCEPDLRRALPLRCTVRAMGGGELQLELRTPQSDPRVLLRDMHRLWAIEHDFIESGSDAQFRGLHALLKAPRHRRDLLLGRRRPAVDISVSLRGSYGEFDAVVKAAMQARDLFLVVGPPGTGKTSHGLVNILREELSHEGASVLLTAYTNRAVDEICAKLDGCGIDYVRLGSASACAEACRTRTVDAIVGEASSLAEVRTVLTGARVYVATTAALNARIELLCMHGFSLAIVDEASQILEPQLAAMFGAMCGREPAIRRFVMIGDHKQLPAVVRQSATESRVDDADLIAAGITDCRMSFFERMIRRYGSDPALACMLTRQGRMHPAIADFPARVFYGGRLLPVPLPHQQAESHEGRVRFVAVEPRESDASDKVNTAEAEAIAREVADVWAELGDAFDAGQSVGVIVPYRNQIAAVRTAIAALCPPQAWAVSIDTVERYQGSQRDCIIFGFTVRNAAQLAFLTDSTITDSDGTVVDRRLNVALTRARERMILVGNPAVLRQNAIFASLIDYCEKCNTVW